MTAAPAAILVSAPASGQGKTTVAAGLARLHARAGARVRAFKCGPDFLDPQWLALATSNPVDPLDLWINGDADCAARLSRAAASADLIVIEGVMGLFDGMPSTADLAQRFALPVLAVIDAGGMAGSFAAIVHGLRTWRRDLPWAGALANRVGSDGHGALLAAALGDDAGWLGHLCRDQAIAVPERHLGLAAPTEARDALARLDRAADALAATPLGRSLARWPRWSMPAAPAVAATEPNAATAIDAIRARLAADPGTEPLAPSLRGCQIAVAHDAAFAFVYQANLDLLETLGATTIPFSPLAGEPLPDCEALWLPGGYPELHAPHLAAQAALRDRLVAHVAAGRPVWAECGGMMVLADALVDGEGRSHPMWGLLPGRVVVGQRLAAIGPQRLPLAAGELRGHSFHWSRLETPLEPVARTCPAHPGVAGPGEPLYQRGSIRASWFHPWFASSPAATARLFGREPLALGLFVALFMAALLLVATEAAVAGDPIVIRDDRGTVHRFAAPPDRIVSLLPSLTETVFALGSGAGVVGVDRYSNWPSAAAALPRLGGLDDALIEPIAALRPDVVLASTSARALDKLESLGFVVVRFRSESHADVRRTLESVARLLGDAEAGDRLWARIDRELAAAVDQVPPTLRGASVYFEIGGGPYAAGPTSFVGETLARLELVNVVPPDLGPFPKLNPEFVVRARPQLVLGIRREIDAMAARPGWATIPALRDDRRCGFATADYELLTRPGPRLGEAAGVLVECLRRLARP
jgi:cobyrinic acid a,c-diamide synthase